MKRVQDALTRQLTSQIERLDSELYAKVRIARTPPRPPAARRAPAPRLTRAFGAVGRPGC